MSWFFERKKYSSKYNADIEIIRFFGHANLYVEGYDQTTSYLRNMWKKSFAFLSKDFKPKRILMLGLGAGGELRTIKKRFPYAYLTVLELDPAMLELAKLFYDKTLGQFPEVILGDAKNTLPKLTGKFDLIIFDLFKGKHPYPLSEDINFIEELKAKLHFRGWFFINVYKSTEILNELSNFFKQWNTVFYKRSVVGIFRHQNQGLIGEALPNKLVLPHSLKDYLEVDALSLSISAFENEKNVFVRWQIGPLIMEQYYGDNEPDLTQSNAKLIFWQPFSRRSKTKGWLPAPLVLNLGVSGFVILDKADYFDDWSTAAKAQRKQWLSQNEFCIEQISFGEFSKAFRQSTVYQQVHEIPLKKLYKKIEKFKTNVELYAIKNHQTQSIVAGLAVLNFHENKFSLHLTAFVLPNQPNFLSTGLINHWFAENIKNKYHHLDLGQFYSPGYPKSWLGFSRFKSQFATRFIRYPNLWMKIRL